MSECKLPSPQNPTEELWGELSEKDVEDIATRSGVIRQGAGWEIAAIGQNFFVDRQNKLITQTTTHEPAPFLLQLVILKYLLKAQALPLVGRLVNPHELICGAFFFRGPHGFNLQPLQEKYARDKEGFLQAGKLAGRQPQQMADAGFSLSALPRIPLTYLLWCADEEFPATIKVFFDATAEKQLPLDMLWVLVNQTNKQLLKHAV